MIYICYHAPCTDGFGAAFAAWKKLEKMEREQNAKGEVTYVPCQYGENPFSDGRISPAKDSSCLVYALDWSMPAEELKMAVELFPNVQIRVIDHHITAEESLKEFPRVDSEEGADAPISKIFAKTRSGAALSWMFFHPGTEVPKLLLYVEDRDLWKWEMPYSQEVSAALRSMPEDFEVWNDLVLFDGVKKLSKEGKAILRDQNKQVNRLADGYKKGYIRHNGERYFVPFVNSPIFQSEICHRLLELVPESPFSLCYSVGGGTDWRYYYSLRSRSDFDVSEVAKEYGGGGHKQAAGCASDQQIIELV